MTLTSGEPGNAIVGSDHVGWICKYSMVRANVINQALLDSLLTGNCHSPVARVYLEDSATAVQTEIGQLTTFFRAENQKSSFKGVFSGTVRPEKLSSSYTNLYRSNMTPTLANYFIIKAGYHFDGSEILVSLFKGVMKDRAATYGTTAGLNINGFDFADRLEGAPGIWSGDDYPTAQSLAIAILNSAGITTYSFNGFTDFSISGISFNNQNGLDTITRLAGFQGTTSWYFDGAGIFNMSDVPTDTTVKYDYSNAPAQSLEFQTTSRDIITDVNIVGNGIALQRQTDSSDQALYGFINNVHQNSIISTQAEAIAAADLIINESRKNDVSLTVAFNPFLVIDDVININHAETGDADKKYRVTGFTHFFDAETFKTRITAEEVSPTLPTINTVP